MTKRLYSICDKVAGEYMPPFPAANDVLALRMFESGLAKVEFPHDYALYHVGYFDLISGFVVQDMDGDDNPHQVDSTEVFRALDIKNASSDKKEI